MVCKGVCAKYKVKKSNLGNIHYKLGHKWCSTCEIFMDWNDIRCPCCKLGLRTKRKNGNAQNQLLTLQLSKKEIKNFCND